MFQSMSQMIQYLPNLSSIKLEKLRYICSGVKLFHKVYLKIGLINTLIPIKNI